MKKKFMFAFEKKRKKPQFASQPLSAPLMSANADSSPQTIAHDAQQLYERLEGLVKSMYESITVGDYHDLVVFAQAQQQLADSFCALDSDLVHEVQQSDPEALRQRILDELEAELSSERLTTPHKIQQCFHTYPMLRDFFKSDLLMRMIEERFNKNALITKFRENPHLLFQDQQCVDDAAAEAVDDQLNLNSPSTTSPANASLDAGSTLDATTPQTLDDSADQDDGDTNDASEEVDSEEDDDDDELIVRDLFTNCALAFLNAYTGRTTHPSTFEDSCHFSGSY